MTKGVIWDEGHLEWVSQSRNRALLVAVFNFAVRTMELIFHMDKIAGKGGIDMFLAQSLEFHTSFFLLRIVPTLLGLFLIFSVVASHVRGCYCWCLSELVVITCYLCLILTTKGTGWGDGGGSWMLYFYSALRLVSILVIYDFLTQILVHNERVKEANEDVLRNHFWHQLSLHQIQKQAQQLREQQLENEHKLQTEITQLK